jgi:hypothetical protein
MFAFSGRSLSELTGFRFLSVTLQLLKCPPRCTAWLYQQPEATKTPTSAGDTNHTDALMSPVVVSCSYLLRLPTDSVALFAVGQYYHKRFTLSSPRPLFDRDFKAASAGAPLRIAATKTDITTPR